MQQENKYDTCPHCGAPCEVIEKVDVHLEIPYVEHKYQPPGTPVWVKATTRLPASWHLKCARFIHTKTFLLDPENWLKDNERAIQDVEWLDEGESPSKEGNNISQDAHEKEVIMQAFSKVRQIFEGRQWIMEGRGSYPYSDDRYQEEVRYMYDEFDQLYKDTWHNIKSKSIEYREWIINEYLHKDHPAIHDILTRLGYCKKEGNKEREARQPTGDMFTFIQWCFNEHPGMITKEHDEWYLSDSTFPELYEQFKYRNNG